MIHGPSSGGSFIAGTMPSFSASRHGTCTGLMAHRDPVSRPPPLPHRENINRNTFIPYARVNAGRFQRAAGRHVATPRMGTSALAS